MILRQGFDKLNPAAQDKQDARRDSLRLPGSLTNIRPRFACYQDYSCHREQDAGHIHNNVAHKHLAGDLTLLVRLGISMDGKGDDRR